MTARLLNGSNGPRPFFAILGAFVALAPCTSAGCGGSTATTTSADASIDAIAPRLAHVVTGGGGAAGASSSSGSGDLFDESGSMSDDSGMTPDSTSSSSSGASSSSGSSGAPDSGSSSGSSSGGPPDSGSSVCDSYTPPLCGTTPCDLRTSTCCVTFTLQARCLPKATAKCASNEVTVGCLQACECPGGQSCCGVMNTIVGVVTSGCQSVPSGGNCQPYPQTVSQASAQLCKVDSECENGAMCISQTCIYGAKLNICGIQSQMPFNCKAN